MTDLRTYFREGVLPPYMGDSPTVRSHRSPYRIGLDEFVSLTMFSSERQEILDGLLNYRAVLRSKGLKGVQWVDGSFVEDIENSERGRPPSDIDLVTWIVVPSMESLDAQVEWFQEIAEWHETLSPKDAFRCDSYLVPQFEGGTAYMDDLSYWGGLFTHSKDGGTWKGIFQLDIDDTDVTARALLAEVAK